MQPIDIRQCFGVGEFGDDATGNRTEYEEKEVLESEVSEGGGAVAAEG